MEKLALLYPIMTVLFVYQIVMNKDIHLVHAKNNIVLVMTITILQVDQDQIEDVSDTIIINILNLCASLVAVGMWE